MKSESKQLLLGIDVGTTGCKCTLYDLVGNPVATAYKDYKMHHLHPGWVEEDPRDWWEACISNLQQLWNQPGIESKNVAAIGVSCANSIIPIGKDNEILHDAIMQIDQRAIGQVKWIHENIGAKKIFDITGNRIAPGTFSLPTILWFKENKPDVFKNTHKYLVPGGFIVWKLTDEFTIDTSRMATTLLGNIQTYSWDEEICEAAGIPISKLPTIHQSSDVVGEVTRKAAELTGLTPGTPVVAGAMDTVAAAIGSSAIDPGSSFLTVGTAARLCLTVDDVKQLDDRFLNCPNTYSDRWLSIAVTNCAGASLRWFRDTLGGENVRQEMIHGGNGYKALNEEAISSTPGANGVLYLPYLSGERSPIWDPYARGVFFGMNLSTRYEDLVRAVMEGVGFSLREAMEIWKNSGVKSDRLTISGGGANSKIWSTIIADILQHPIYRLNVNETETLGAALLAGMGIGLIKDPNQVTSNMINNEQYIEPNQQNSELYLRMYELYNSVYKHLKDDFYQLEKINLMRQK